MLKNRQPSDLCLNHPRLAPEMLQAEASRHAEKLRRALGEAVRESRREDAVLSGILGRGEVFESVEGLDVAISALAFPDTRSGPSRMFGFTWEWIDENDVRLIAEEMVTQVREAVAEGDLPREAGGFLPD